MSKIKFESYIQKQDFHNVLKGYSKETFEVEVRSDPLLQNTSIYNKLLKGKLKVLFGISDEGLINDLVAESAKTCILCDNRIEGSTPKYPDELIESGRIRTGESFLFPNLFPIGKYHAVIAVSKAHFLRLNEFDPKLLSDAFTSAQIFVNSVKKTDPSPLYITLNANYLFPAGASLVHPHLQLLITSIPYSYHKQLIQACNSYFEQNNSNYFNALINVEKKKDERYVLQKGKWHVLASYAPSGSNEIIVVHEDTTDFSLLTELDVKDIASVISKILSYYDKLGFLSFNFTFLSNINSPSLHCLLKIMTRQNLYQNYRNDDYYLQKILQSELMITLPEELASGLKEFMESSSKI